MDPKLREELRYFEELNQHWWGLEARAGVILAVAGLAALVLATVASGETSTAGASQVVQTVAFALSVLCMTVALLLVLSILWALQKDPISPGVHQLLSQAETAGDDVFEKMRSRVSRYEAHSLRRLRALHHATYLVLAALLLALIVVLLQLQFGEAGITPDHPSTPRPLNSQMDDPTGGG